MASVIHSSCFHASLRLRRVREDVQPDERSTLRRRPVTGESRAVTVLEMERTVTVEFGPSRSKRFAKALAFARERADECVEVEPGKYRASFELGSEPGSYRGLQALIGAVRYWRATVVYQDDEPVSAYHTREMAGCAAFQLQVFAACHWHFSWGVLPRCSGCPLFDAERAFREALRPGRRPLTIFVARRLLRDVREAPLPDWDERADTRPHVPDFVPEEWQDPPGEDPPS
jgi:hypothetical protein